MPGGSTTGMLLAKISTTAFLLVPVFALAVEDPAGFADTYGISALILVALGLWLKGPLDKFIAAHIALVDRCSAQGPKTEEHQKDMAAHNSDMAEKMAYLTEAINSIGGCQYKTEGKDESPE